MGKAKQDTLSKVASGSLADLIGESVSVRMDNGTVLVVPVDAGGNRIANMILAANIRHMIETSLKKYRDQDTTPSPKDLKDMAEAAKTIGTFSGDVYKGEQGAPINDKPKVVERPNPVVDVDFGEQNEPAK